MNVQTQTISPVTAVEDGDKPFRVVVIGGGISGVLMGIKLQDAGIENFTIYEKASELGGTWRDNIYPGVACDVASHHFCYSFEGNPGWSRRFPPGAEIKAYVERTAEKYGVTRFIRFNSQIVSTKWDGRHWQLTTKTGERDYADVLVSAVGVLQQPKIPDFKGLDTFAGPCFHTSQWRKDVDFKGKRVGVIGNGSTAAQVIPNILEKADKIVHFQRTAQWMMPLPDKEYKGWEKAVYRY
ncbi:MAG: NAD(P)/FAD-dependent oxidoreductase, partial [Pseudomonadota bacterium]